MTFLVIGGSSGLGRALAERFALAGHPLVLVSSDIRDTQAIASDLNLRCAIPVLPIVLDLADPAVSFEAIDSAIASLPPLAGILLPAGLNLAGDRPGQPGQDFDAIVRVNFSVLCRLIDHYLGVLKCAQGGVIVGFGSVAAIRGRTRNAAYAAAKRALDSYFESLRHALSGSNVIAQYYVLGYLDTNLAFAENTPLPRASPRRLAEVVFDRRQRDFGRTFYPRFWYPLCLLLRLLPWFIYRRLSF